LNSQYGTALKLERHFVTRYKELIPSVFTSVPYVRDVDASNHNLTPTQNDYFVDSTTASLSTTLNRIAPLKKVINRRRVAPW
jgi:hypothetical protein